MVDTPALYMYIATCTPVLYVTTYCVYACTYTYFSILLYLVVLLYSSDVSVFSKVPVHPWVILQRVTHFLLMLLQVGFNCIRLCNTVIRWLFSIYLSICKIVILK